MPIPVSATVIITGPVGAYVVDSVTRPPLWVSAIVVGAFAVFHGYAHGAELPEAANPLLYTAGFMVATGLLHVGGIVVGLAVRWPTGAKVVRGIGAVISLAGVGFLTGTL
jgi:urease accessory protein